MLGTDSYYDSPPQKPAIFLTNVSWLVDTRKDAMTKKYIYTKNVFMFAKEGLSNDDVGTARGTVFQGLRPRAGVKTGDFVKEKLGGLP